MDGAVKVPHGAAVDVLEFSLQAERLVRLMASHFLRIS